MQTVKIQISLRRYMVWSGTLLYFVMLYSTQWFYKRTVKVLISVRGPVDTFLHGVAHMSKVCARWVRKLVTVNFFRCQISYDILSAFYFLTNYRLERSLYIKLKDWMSNSIDPDETAHYEPSHLDLCCLQKPIIIACGNERVKHHGKLKRDVLVQQDKAPV